MTGARNDSHAGTSVRGISVIVPTWNSASRLRRALESVAKSLRPAQLVIVDRDSEDGTVGIAEEHGAEVLTDTVSLGSARMKGVWASDSAWICFVDDDIVIPEGFWHGVEKVLDQDVGAVQGAVVSVHHPHREMLIEEYEQRFSGQDAFDLRPGERGLTSATLIRKDLIEDLELADVNTWEDWLITQKVIDSGHRWVVIRPYVDHFHPHEDLARKEGWNAAGILNLGRTGRMPPWQALRWYLDIVWNIPRNGLRLAFRFRDPAILFLSINSLLSVLMAPRYLIGVVPRKAKG